MGPSVLSLPQLGGGDEAHRRIASIVERLVPSDIASLAPGKVQLTVLLNENGGIIDDLMIGRPPRDDQQGMLYIVVNAGMKENDFALIAKAAGADAELHRADDRALIAIQGPEAEAVIAGILPDAVPLTFMTFREIKTTAFGNVVATRCGYTGEDGFEILVPAEHGEAFASRLLEDPRVKPIGLGARDSLRLEANYPLYGHEISERISPIQAGLGWTVKFAKADFIGREALHRQAQGGPSSSVVLFSLDDRRIARQGAVVFSGETPVGEVLSGTQSPVLGKPIGTALVAAGHAASATLTVDIRGNRIPLRLSAEPFVK